MKDHQSGTNLGNKAVLLTPQQTPPRDAPREGEDPNGNPGTRIDLCPQAHGCCSLIKISFPRRPIVIYWVLSYRSAKYAILMESLNDTIT